jgi:hypothetical protein
MAASVCLKNVMVDINPAEITHGYYDHTNCQIVAPNVIVAAIIPAAAINMMSFVFRFIVAQCCLLSTCKSYPYTKSVKVTQANKPCSKVESV